MPVSGSVPFAWLFLCKETIDSDGIQEVEECLDSFWETKTLVDANPLAEIESEDRLECERVSDNETLDETDSETGSICDINTDSDKDSETDAEADSLTDCDSKTDSEADSLKDVDVSSDLDALTE